MSSWVRPGVREVRARLVRPVSALMSEDLPTFERPAKAISGGPTGGRPSERAAAKKNSQFAREQLAPRLGPVGRDRLLAHTLGVFAGLLFLLGNSLAKLSHSSIFTPAFFMISDCWMTVRVLFQVQ